MNYNSNLLHQMLNSNEFLKKITHCMIECLKGILLCSNNVCHAFALKYVLCAERLIRLVKCACMILFYWIGPWVSLYLRGVIFTRSAEVFDTLCSGMLYLPSLVQVSNPAIFARFGNIRHKSSKSWPPPNWRSTATLLFEKQLLTSTGLWPESLSLTTNTPQWLTLTDSAVLLSYSNSTEIKDTRKKVITGCYCMYDPRCWNSNYFYKQCLTTAELRGVPQLWWKRTWI